MTCIVFFEVQIRFLRQTMKLFSIHVSGSQVLLHWVKAQSSIAQYHWLVLFFAWIGSCFRLRHARTAHFRGW